VIAKEPVPGRVKTRLTPPFTPAQAAALAEAQDTLAVPLVLIGMDTPQVTPGLLAAAAGPLVSDTADATFGLAEDGGFWLLGLRKIDPALVLGVPMSQPDTGSRQLLRLERAGLRVRRLPELIDVDTVAEAEHIAAATPCSAFAACLAGLRYGFAQAAALTR